MLNEIETPKSIKVVEDPEAYLEEQKIYTKANYKVVFFPTISAMDIMYCELFPTLKQAKTALDIIANYSLFLDENNVLPDLSNLGYVCEFIDGEWQEIEE